MIKNIKGTKDLLPNSTYDLQDIENHLMRFLHIHGYGEIRTPIFETTDLFSRSVGENTDIVVIYSGEGSDEASGSYLYFHKAPTYEEFRNESNRLMKDLS